MTIEIARKLQELDAATFQALCDDLLPLIDDEYKGLEPYGRQLKAKKTRKGTPDSYVRCDDGKYIAIQHTTEQTGTRKKVIEDIEKLADPKLCKIHDKIKKVVVCFNSQPNPDDIDAYNDAAKQRGWELDYFSLSKLTKALEDNLSLAKKYLGVDTPSTQKDSIPKFNRTYRISAIIITIVLAFSLWWIFHPSDKYQSNAMQFKPCLEVIGEPEILSHQLSNLPKDMHAFLRTKKPPGSNDTLDISADITIRFKLDLLNTGNATAKVYAYTGRNTSFGGFDIREKLFDKKNRDRFFMSSPFEDFYEFQEAQPKKTTYIEVARLIKFPQDNNFAMHFIILYMNDLGNLFDTYYIARYSLIPFRSELYNKGLKASDFIKFLNDRSATMLYSRNQAKDVINFLNKNVSKRGTKK